MVQGAQLIHDYWYVAAPAALALALIAIVRLRYWPAASGMGHWRGLLVDVSEQRVLILLIHAARQDRRFRAEVLKLLRLPPETRRALLEETLANMRTRGESESLVEAIGLLRDEHVVARTVRLLEEEP
jgi:hypothetical protein